MKLIHTGDWHVGKTLHRRQRLDEAQRVLDEVVDLSRSEEADVVVICGDIFEHYAPSAEAERIVYATVLALRATGAHVVVIPGNHDNAKRFAAIEELLAAAGVHLVPEVRRPDAGGILELAARDGTRVQIACLPWIPERLLYSAADLMGEQAGPHQEYAEELPKVVRALCADLDPMGVTVFVGHLFVSGARLGGGERDLTIGRIFAIDPATLPTTVQYIALGHVHRPQDVGAATPARYAGSLLQLDFGEMTQDKTVTVVELAPKKPARVTERKLSSGRRLVDVRGTLSDLDAYRDTEEQAWLRVTLVCDGPQPGLADQVRAVLPHALEVRLDYPRADPQQRAGELRRLSPGDLFARYYGERHAAPPDASVLKLFDELLEEVLGEAA